MVVVEVDVVVVEYVDPYRQPTHVGDRLPETSANEMLDRSKMIKNIHLILNTYGVDLNNAEKDANQSA